MGLPNVRNILRVPGKLCVNPTALSGDFPHGGTALGVVRDIEFKPNIRTGIVTAEEWGSVAVEAVYSGDSAVLACVLREWDDDAISAMFLDTTSTTTAIPSATSPSGFEERVNIQSRVSDGTTQATGAGLLLSTKSAIVLFSPLAVDSHPAFLLRKALPMIGEAAMLQASLAEEFGVAVVWQAIPDSSTGLVWEAGLMKNMVAL